MHNIRIKLLAPFILGTLVLTLVLTGYAYYSAQQALQSATLLISRSQATQASNTITVLLRSMSVAMHNMVTAQHTLGLFAQQKEAPSASVLDSAVTWLEAITYGNEHYRDILIVDTAGVCIASSNPAQIGNVYADRPHVQLALQGFFNFGDISIGRMTKKFSATLAGPIDSEGAIVGALVLVADFPRLVDYETEIRNHGDRTIFTALMDPQGMFIAHRDMTLMGNTERRFPDLYATLSGAGEQGGVVQYILEGDTFIGFAQLEPVSKTLIITSGTRKDVFAPANRVGLTLLSISLLFLCAISFIVFRFANDILNSLLSLIRYAKRVSEGDLALRLKPTVRKDELGILHNALCSQVNVMHTALHKSEEASKMKSAFLANMSHEIRTPLNAIISMTHLALRDGNLAAKQHTYLENTNLAAHSLLGVINDILDISKVEAGMLSIEHIPFNLKENVENILAVHQTKAQEKGIALALDYSAAAPVFVVGDPLRIGQVLNNLLSNSIKFTPEGSVSVRCWAEATEVDNTVAMHVSVTDTGIGMSQAVMDILFQPFTQADDSISRKFGGTGLGLAISKRIVELMEGDIRVESCEGQGSTFSFFIRLSLAEQELEKQDVSSHSTAFESLHLKTRRILVAEDNPINQFVLQELLEPTGVQIVLANNGQEALDAVKVQAFDLVLMDMQMPVMGGLEATAKIRELPTAKLLPIIAVTANAMAEDKTKGFACGMNAYLTKPIDPAELLHVLRDYLGGDTPSA